MLQKVIFITCMLFIGCAKADIYAPASFICTGSTVDTCQSNLPIDPNFRIYKEGNLQPGTYYFSSVMSEYYSPKESREPTKIYFKSNDQYTAYIVLESITNNIEATLIPSNKWFISGKKASSSSQGTWSDYPLTLVFGDRVKK